MTKRATLGIVLSLAAGCVASEDGDGFEDGIMEQAATVLTSRSYTGTPVAAVSRRGVTIAEGRLLREDGDGAVGLALAATLEDGNRVRLRVESTESIALGDGSKLVAYRVSYTSDGESWARLCGDRENLAVVIDGRWDYRAGVALAGGPIEDADHFTFACRGAAIASCVELGYAPWRSVDKESLRDHHAACVRMLRGDFCGDGTSWAEPGRWIAVEDELGIQTDGRAWPVDATWSARGATCAARRPFPRGAPACFAQLAALSCTADFTDDTLLAGSVALRRPGTPAPTGPATAVSPR